MGINAMKKRRGSRPAIGVAAFIRSGGAVMMAVMVLLTAASGFAADRRPNIIMLYPGVYTCSDTSKWFHPLFPSYNPAFTKEYFDIVNMFEWERVAGQPVKKVAEINYACGGIR